MNLSNSGLLNETAVVWAQQNRLKDSAARMERRRLPRSSSWSLWRSSLSGRDRDLLGVEGSFEVEGSRLVSLGS